MTFFSYNFGDNDEKGDYMYINVQAEGNANVSATTYSNGVEYSPDDMGEPEKDAERNIIYNSDGHTVASA